MKEEKFENGYIYKPENYEMKAIDSKIGVKFSNDTVILKSFLDAQGIEYKLEDLEDVGGGFGLGIRIKRD